MGDDEPRAVSFAERQTRDWSFLPYAQLSRNSPGLPCASSALGIRREGHEPIHVPAKPRGRGPREVPAYRGQGWTPAERYFQPERGHPLCYRRERCGDGENVLMEPAAPPEIFQVSVSFEAFESIILQHRCVCVCAYVWVPGIQPSIRTLTALMHYVLLFLGSSIAKIVRPHEKCGVAPRFRRHKRIFPALLWK